MEEIEQVRKEAWKETYTDLDQEFIEKRFRQHHQENIARLQRKLLIMISIMCLYMSDRLCE
jgi:hypothetical protein